MGYGDRKQIGIRQVIFFFLLVLWTRVRRQGVGWDWNSKRCLAMHPHKSHSEGNTQRVTTLECRRENDGAVGRSANIQECFCGT